MSVAAGGTGKVKLKAMRSQARAMKKGARYFLNVQARGDDGGLGQARRTIRIG